MTSNSAGSMTAAHKHIRTATLDVAYEESGGADGTPVLLLHGWPYDPRCYDEVVPPLVAAGCRVIVLSLRRHIALGPAGGARQRFARIARRARHRARHPCRLRLGRPCRLYRRGAV